MALDSLPKVAIGISEDVIAETLYRLRRAHPKAPGRLTRSVHDRVVEQLDDRVVEYDIDDTFPGTDENDAHVHAAAVASTDGILLTSDKGFTNLADEVLDRLPYEVHEPDSFFGLVDDSHPRAVKEVTRQQAHFMLNRDGEVDLAKRLTDAGCPTFARRVAHHLLSLEGP